MHVLIADSDKAFLEIAQRYLSRHGHEVQTATNGLESVAFFDAISLMSWCSGENCSGGAAMVS